eukprot:scaffold5037_cov114-Isochrysis_galbana.AAC.14
MDPTVPLPVGAGWLKTDPEREQAVRSAAKLFVSICESQEPFVAVENPKMHSLATDLVVSWGAQASPLSMFNLTSTERATRKSLACT